MENYELCQFAKGFIWHVLYFVERSRAPAVVEWDWCKLSCCFSSLLAFEMCRFVWLRSGEHKYITLWTWSQVRHQVTRMSSIKWNQVRLSTARLSGIRHQGYVICMWICCGMAPTKALSVCRWVFTGQLLSMFRSISVSSRPRVSRC